MKWYFKIYKNYNDYYRGQSLLKKNKFYFSLAYLIDIVLNGFILGIIVLLGGAFLLLIAAPILLGIVFIFNLSFKTYFLIEGISFNYLYLSIIFLAIIYSIANHFIKTKTGLDYSEYIDQIKTWEKQFKLEIKN